MVRRKGKNDAKEMVPIVIVIRHIFKKRQMNEGSIDRSAE